MVPSPATQGTHMNVFKFVPTQLAVAAVSLAAIALPGVAHADAVAQSILEVNAFTVTSTGASAATFVSAASNTTLTTNLVGFGSQSISNNPTPQFDNRLCNGPDCAATYLTPGGRFIKNLSPFAPIGNLAGAGVQITGAPNIAGGSTARAESNVQVTPRGDGASTGNTNLSSDFQVALAGPGRLQFNFNANLFLRSYLDGSPMLPFANATATAGWSMTIAGNGFDVFQWNPVSGAGGGALCNITGASTCVGSSGSGAFSLTNRQTSVNNTSIPLDRQIDLVGGLFAANTGDLAAGVYTITIQHNTGSNARIDIPEPNSLALIGIALLGAAAAASRRRKV